MPDVFPLMLKNGPLYGLNTALSERTAEPPVPQAKAWAETYPSVNSPLLINDSSASSSSSRATTLGLLNLAQGVPGHAPHEKLRKAMAVEYEKDLMTSHGYGPVFGDPSLRQALSDNLNRRYKGDIKSEEVAITSGANLAAAVAFHALAEPSDAVVLPTPWYFNHEMTLRSLSIDVIPLETRSPTFEPKPEALIRLLETRNVSKETGKIKAMVLVTPNNPTGSIYGKDRIYKFARICAEWKIALILDETYREFLLDESDVTIDGSAVRPFGKPHDLFDSTAYPAFDWRNTIISIHSFSKSFAIPGHRLGAIITHSSLLVSETKEPKSGVSKNHFGSLAKSLDNLQICPPRIDTQRAVAAGISDQDQLNWRLQVANDLLDRRKRFASSLEDKLSEREIALQLRIDEERLAELTRGMPATSPSRIGWKLLSSGAYYAYVRHPFPDTKSEVVARGLAALVGVVVLPGSYFRPKEDAESDRDLRISIANVNSELLDTLAARLLLLHALWQAKGVGWGI